MERYHLPTHMKHAMPTEVLVLTYRKHFATVRLLGLDDDDSSMEHPQPEREW